MEIRLANAEDFDGIWPIFHEIVSAGETYTYPPKTNRAEAYHLWMEKPKATFVAVEEGLIMGTYYITPNKIGLGDHVCNCGYMVGSAFRGRGIAAAMCEHSQQIAVEMGFLAMQYNSVVVTNVGAVRLWQKLGFEIIGTMTKSFRHAKHGLTDAHIMYKWLG